jgi:hypothetical protein
MTEQEPQQSTDYERIADKVGFVPNVRKKDNLYQGLSILGTILVGMLLGYILMGESMGLLLGGLAGAILGLLVSGVVLMIVGLMRK